MSHIEEAFRADRLAQKFKLESEATHFLSQLSVEMGLKASDIAKDYWSFAEFK